MTNLCRNCAWNIEFTLEGISTARRHVYFYTVLILTALAANAIVGL